MSVRSVLRLRMSSHDAHYGGDLVDGARMLGLFGDVATELCILHDGDEGLFRAYDSVEFLAPVHAGDGVSLTCECECCGSTDAAGDPGDHGGRTGRVCHGGLLS